MHLPCIVLAAALASFGQAGDPPAKIPQFPSPMVEHTRAHTRLKDERPPGKRIALKLGTLFLPDSQPAGDGRLFLHFHGGTLASEVAAAKASVAVISVPLGSGSSTYAKPFADPKIFADLLEEAEAKAGRKFEHVGLTGWSAGYGAVRAILKVPQHYDRVEFVVLLDGLHAGYKGGKPGPKESEILADDLAVFAQFAKDAALGKMQFVLTHSEIFPGTYASTTETADWLLGQLKLKRTPVLRWGPMGTQILSETKEGRFHLLGFAGNSAPDHVDILHSLPELLAEVEWKAAK
jgi:hypothetical protein